MKQNTFSTGSNRSLIGSLNDINSTSLFGTTSFNLVWEDVCSDILNNQLHTPIAVLATPLKPVNHFYVSKKLLDIIEKPQWTITGKEADKTLIPDLITISGDQFLIFDAKYYTPVLSPGKIRHKAVPLPAGIPTVHYRPRIKAG